MSNEHECSCSKWFWVAMFQAKVHASTSTSLHNSRAASCDELPPTKTGPSRLLSLPNLLMPIRNGFRSKREKRGDQEVTDHHSGGGAAPPAEKDKKSPEQLMRTYQELVDAKALVVFPVAFLLFDIGYWLHYLINT